MEYCLIEKWSSGLSLPAKVMPIALTPQASYELDECGVNHKTLAEYYSSGEIRGDTDTYLKSQLEWFKEVDRLARDLFPDAQKMNIDLASLYFHSLKYLVDCVVLTTRLINKFLDSTTPSKVWFIPNIYGDDKIGLWLFFHFGESSFSRLAEPLCRQRGIPFEKLISENIEEKSQSLGLKGFLRKRLYNSADLKSLLKALLPKGIKHFLKNIQQQYLIYRNFSTCSFDSNRKGKILLLKAGKDYIHTFCKDAHKSGFALFFKSGSIIYRPSFLPWFKKINLSRSGQAKLQEGCPEDNEIIYEKIMDWISRQCNIDISPILYSRIKYYFRELFPRTLLRIKWFVNFYNENKIDFVVLDSLFSEDDFAAVAAAKISENTKSICFCHGSEAFLSKIKFFIEVCHFDFYFTFSSAEVKNIKWLCELYNVNHICVEEYSYFRDRFRSLSVAKKVNKVSNGHKSDKPIVVFAPIMRTERMSMPIDRSQSLQMDYINWHHALIDYFASRPDYHFIWKALPQLYGRGDSIKQILEHQCPKNITYSSSRLIEWLAVAQRAIFDVPSTAFFEGIFTGGLPVLALFRPKDQDIREDMKRICGESLQPYSSNEEGIKVIGEFLDSDLRKYIVSLPQSEASIPDILERGLLKTK